MFGDVAECFYERESERKKVLYRTFILQETGLPEGEKSARLRVGFRVTDDYDMVLHFKFENLG
jgi:hypothetical protein